MVVLSDFGRGYRSSRMGPSGNDNISFFIIGDRATGYADDITLLLDCGLSRGFGFGCGRWVSLYLASLD